MVSSAGCDSHNDVALLAPRVDKAVRFDDLREFGGPHIVEVAMRAAHDKQSVVGPGCDDQFEFEFAPDILLDGFERLHLQGWSSTNQPTAAEAAVWPTQRD